MRLAIDGKRLIQPRTGPGRWLEHMLRCWSHTTLPFEEIRCYTPGPTDASWALPPALQHVVLPTRLSPILWENLHLRRAAAGADVLFGASYTLPLGFRKPSVVSIQGIYEGPHALPGPPWHRLRFSALYRASARQADVVLANSMSTKNDLVRYYDINPDRIRVVHQGIGAPFCWRPDRDEVRAGAAFILGFEDPYLLFVGKLSVRRHVPELLAAYREAMPQLPEGMRLLLVGPDHVGLQIRRQIARQGVEGHACHIPFLKQAELAIVYSAATAFFLPTTHEGFSATILEAMACRTPVVTVDHAALHDGVFEYVWALEAPDVGLLRDAMIRISNDTHFAEELGQLGGECSQRFTWERTANDTIRACWEVANRR